MPKNILIFADGTGQLGGIRADQRLSNVYKMYRAMRPWPDSPISAADQVAFYDAGLGTGEGGSAFSFQRVRNMLGSAFGSGIGENIADCYEAILKHWQEGDRVYLFGFSRGAYTVRCVANVLNLCGVPRHMADGSPLVRHGPAVRRLAEEAVYRVYEHGSGKGRADYEAEREELARRFRERHGSQGVGRRGEPQGNVAPTFVGVFDTVAALGGVIARRVVLGLLLLTVLLGTAAWAYDWPLAAWAAALLAGGLATTYAWALAKQLKWITDPPSGGRLSWHVASWKLEHYDRYLDTSVGNARHALSIDENRKRFPQVGWGYASDVRAEAGRVVPWLEQVWFAGNHSDVGGSYPEEESRLSDVALGWMMQELARVSYPPCVNRALLQLYPDPLGVQHDEVAASRDAWLPRWSPWRLGWSRQARTVHPEAKLHPSVLERLAAPSVPQYGTTEAYRPGPLADHELAKRLFGA